MSDVPWDLLRAIVRLSFSLRLGLALMVSVAGCASIHLDRDPDIAPAANVDRVWSPPQSVITANGAAPRLEELSNGRQEVTGRAYDLPAVVDLALRTNPQTQRAWYAAQAAQAQLGQSHAADYPKIDAEGVGGYLKLPIEFPGQTLVIRNEAFLPQIKVSYDLLDFGRTAPRSAARASSSSPRTSRSTARSRTLSSTSKRPTTSSPRRKRA